MPPPTRIQRTETEIGQIHVIVREIRDQLLRYDPQKAEEERRAIREEIRAVGNEVDELQLWRANIEGRRPFLQAVLAFFAAAVGALGAWLAK